MVKKLFRLPGGIRPTGHKVNSAEPIQIPPIFPTYVLPLTAPFSLYNNRSLVSVGETVLKYQCIASPEDERATAVHAPTSGTVIDISLQPSAHISGLAVPCITIESDGEDRALPPSPLQDPTQLFDHLQHMGLVGLGGAMFPTHQKVKNHCDTLIINGAECEPYISCDDALMTHCADDILLAAHQLAEQLSLQHILFGIEDNKPSAIEALQKSLKQHQYNINCRIIPTRYPSGSAKQLTYILTGQAVPHDQHLSDIGVLCLNPATILAIQQAVQGYPLIERITTITGDIAHPANHRVRIGTRLIDLLAALGIQKQHVILGGSLMGHPISHQTAPIEKGHNCFICLDRLHQETEMPCIQCGECVHVCPVHLQPQELYWYSRAEQFDKAQSQYGLFDCIECNACSYVCPSHIPLTAYYQYAKSAVRARAREQKETEEAKQRFEARTERLRQRKEARLKRLQEHSQRLQNSNADKMKLVQSAIQRVQNKKRLSPMAEETPPDPLKE